MAWHVLHDGCWRAWAGDGLHAVCGFHRRVNRPRCDASIAHVLLRASQRRKVPPAPDRSDVHTRFTCDLGTYRTMCNVYSFACTASRAHTAAWLRGGYTWIVIRSHISYAIIENEIVFSPLRSAVCRVTSRTVYCQIKHRKSTALWLRNFYFSDLAQ